MNSNLSERPRNPITDDYYQETPMSTQLHELRITWSGTLEEMYLECSCGWEQEIGEDSSLDTINQIADQHRATT